MRVTILGCGTSSGVPSIGCDCPVCLSTDPRNNRTRSSIYIEKNGQALLVDCGPDFRQQALREGISRVDALFITHTHADHIHGMDDLRAVNWKHGGAVPVLASGETLRKLGVIFDYCFNPIQIGGGVPQFELRELAPLKTIDFHGIAVTPIPISHGVLTIWGFRFDNLAYLTDCSGIPDSSRPFIEGADTLILSALRRKPHSTHFSVQQAVEESRRLGARRTYFIHMTHDLDYEETNRALPEGMALLYDGMKFEVGD